MFNAMMESLLLPSAGFRLGTLAGNISKYGRRWGFDLAIALGAGLFILGVKELIKAVNSQQGAGGHYFRGFVGCVLGAIMMFGAPHFERMMGGSDLFSELIGSGFITSMTSLPMKDWINFL